MDEEERRERPLVVVIDDDELVSRTLREVLEGAGYAVETSGDWVEGYHLVRARQPVVVLADILFDGEPKGWQLLQTLVLDQRTRHIPLVAMSADLLDLTVHGERLRSMRVRLLSKPCTASEVLDAVQEAGQPRPV